ncbi:SAM-dependent methyltransferase [Leekyejoonella antrihumi]|uniref:SAM-dependent methyltransferase n=1 Tax=Leekyejoonella antrihumi TaxID=1660198 RepID=UPI001645AB2D|nr:cyclopropane-fatty-acyl-phospholipid synthase family protein [Leekyejoonella antrihumi]
MVEKRLIDQVLRRIRSGRAIVRFWDGDERSYGSSGRLIHVAADAPLRLRKTLGSASLAFGEAYVRGDIRISENELDDFFWIIAHNQGAVHALKPLRRVYRRERNRRSRQRDQVSRHYDVGNDYYRLFLDSSLTYSCGYFEHEGDSLEAAQVQKIDHVLRKLRLEPGQRLLDVGSGWGALAVAAAKKYDVQAVGITLSHEQLAGSNELAAREGVSDRVQFRLMNYQDLPGADDPAVRGPYDRIASVGMFEHVGRHLHRNYFQVLHGLLTPGGVGMVHAITNQMHQGNDAWTDRHIFPGGYLPTVQEVEGLLADEGLWSIDRENLWQHYVRTLSAWRRNHQENHDRIVAMFDEEFYRTRDLWLAGSKAGFDYGTLGLAQFVFTRGKPTDWPLTRRGLYAQAAAGGPRHLVQRVAERAGSSVP